MYDELISNTNRVLAVLGVPKGANIMATFKSWTHPATGETRIYISGLPGQKSAKVFVVAQAADSFGFEFDIRTQVPEGVYANRAELVNDAERAIFEACQARVKTFSAVQALAE